VRVQAALVLGKLGDPRAVQPLIKALADQNKTVRGIAASALDSWVIQARSIRCASAAPRDRFLSCAGRPRRRMRRWPPGGGRGQARQDLRQLRRVRRAA
jgi:hypothetical protein